MRSEWFGDWLVSFLTSGLRQSVRYNSICRATWFGPWTKLDRSVHGQGQGRRYCRASRLTSTMMIYDQGDLSNCTTLLWRMSARGVCWLAWNTGIRSRNGWMASRRLQRFKDWTQLAWCGLVGLRETVSAGWQLIGGAIINPSATVRNLGVMVPQGPCPARHVRQLLPHPAVATSSPLIDVDAAHVLVHAMIHSRLDYCNSIPTNAPLSLLNCLQSVRRSSARLVLHVASAVGKCVQASVTSSTGCQCSNASHSNSAPWHSSLSTDSHLSTTDWSYLHINL